MPIPHNTQTKIVYTGNGTLCNLGTETTLRHWLKSHTSFKFCPHGGDNSSNTPEPTEACTEAEVVAAPPKQPSLECTRNSLWIVRTSSQQGHPRQTDEPPAVCMQADCTGKHCTYGSCHASCIKRQRHKMPDGHGSPSSCKVQYARNTLETDSAANMIPIYITQHTWKIRRHSHALKLSRETIVCVRAAVIQGQLSHSISSWQTALICCKPWASAMMMEDLLTDAWGHQRSHKATKQLHSCQPLDPQVHEALVSGGAETAMLLCGHATQGRAAPRPAAKLSA